MSQQNKVLIGVPTEEYARRSDFYDYFNLLQKPNNSMVLFCHERSPAKSRNILIEQAEQHDCTHVLFIDDDMAYPPDSLMKLLENADKDLVSGLYFSRTFPHQPLAFDVADENGAALHMYMEEDTPRIVPIVAAGFGFLLARIESLHKMEKPYVRLGELDPQEWCDDIGFFNRARKAGLQAYCDTEVRVGHIGTMIIWPNKFDGRWYSGYDTTGIGITGNNGRQMVNAPQANIDIVYQEQKSGS